MYPFKEKKINDHLLLREFDRSYVSDDQMWHRDKEDRTVVIVESGGWSFQKDNELPKSLSKGDKIFIKKEEWHRVIKGEGKLVVKVILESSMNMEMNENEFSYKIAQAAVDGKKEVKIGDKTYPVKMTKEKAKKILDEKDSAFKESDNPHPGQYSAPQGSKRDKQLDATKADLKSGDPERIARAYRRREKMEKKARSSSSFRNKPRKDTKREAVRMTESQLRGLIRGLLQEKLSAKTKATLKKKAEKRGLTPGSVYAEFRKGLAAWATSGSRKGMSQHQWAHARVNSATPSKPWAVVKKSKRKKSKKKKK